MQTVILGSERFDCLPALLDRDPGGTPVVYVPTAADVLDDQAYVQEEDVLDDQAYVQEEMHRLAGMGFQIIVLPLAGASRERVAARLGQAGLVFVTGGNAFHLLHHAMLSGFTELVPPLVRSGALVYVGMSAGAHLATPDLLPCVSEDTRWKAPELATTKAMGLVSFSVLAHYGDPDRAERHRHLLAAPQPRPVVPVTGAQLIVVRGSRRSVIPAVP